MSKTINLRNHRKRKQREVARQQGAEQRALHGRTPAQKQAEAAREQAALARWAGHQRDPDDA